MEILITGTLASFPPAIFQELMKNHNVVVAGQGLPKQTAKRLYSAFQHSPQDVFFPEVFRLYHFNAVIFFMSRGEQLTGWREGSPESLGAVLSQCAGHGVKRVICVSSTETCADLAGADESSAVGARSTHGILLESAERLCGFFRENHGIHVSLVRIPYLYGPNAPDTLLGRAILQASSGKKVELPGAGDHPCDLIHTADISALLDRMLDSESEADPPVLHAGGGKPTTFATIASLLEKRFPDCSVAFAADPASVPPRAISTLARQLYDWVAIHELEHDFSEVADAILKFKPARPTLWSRVKAVMSKRKWYIQLLEILLTFVLMEFLVTVTGDTLQFRFIDFRLLFVVIIGVIHGIRSGVLAALLACLSIIFAYVSMRMDWRAVVYNVDNWLPFVAYLLAGAVTGYIRDKNDSDLDFLKQKTAAHERHYNFLYDLYNQTLGNLNKYKSQLIGYRDSFGRVYEITRRLDHMVPDAVFQHAVQILEDTLGSTTIAVYTVDPSKAYARLAVSSAGLADQLGRSIAVHEYAEMFLNLKKDQVWVNRRMLENYPFYCVPIYRGESLTAVVMAFDVPFAQKSAAGANQFLVICGLIQAALVRAITYNEATEAQSCIAGTHILTAGRFAELLSIRRNMQSMKIANYSLLRVEDPIGELSRLSDLIEQGIRRTDIIGQGADGRIYILLSQAQLTANEPIVKRLESLGVRCTVAEAAPNGITATKDAGDVA